nr:Retrovirus-related Pol polyprotein from transposon TNT 1-94 [Ipomoea batatas]
MDIWGPYKVATTYGHQYFLTILDDHSRAVWIYLMKGKSEARGLIVGFCNLVENQFGTKVKCIRSDNGLEFNMVEFFKQKGIIHQTSCTYTPQQNSRVERKHGHLLSTARALKFQANLPEQFWGECVLHTAYIINRLPSAAINNRIPYQVLIKKVPHVPIEISETPQSHSQVSDNINSEQACLYQGEIPEQSPTPPEVHNQQ